MSSTAPSLVALNGNEQRDVPIAILEAVSALQTADALLRWRLRDHFDLRTSDMLALEYVARLELLDQPVRALDIARVLGVTNGASTIIVTRLMEHGLLHRTKNPRDGRSHLLHLSTAASAALSAATGNVHAEVHTLLAALSPRESNRIVKLLTAISDSLTSVQPGPPRQATPSRTD